MQPLTFEPNALTARIERLDPKDRAKFAVGCAERMLPYYQRFHDQTGQGDPDVLTDALNAARAKLMNDPVNFSDFMLMAKRCEALVPIEDDSWTDLSAIAQNAAAAAAYALRCLVSGSPQDAVWAAVQGYEAADLLSSTALNVDFNEPGVEKLIVTEDVVQQELAAQDALLRQLEESRSN